MEDIMKQASRIYPDDPDKWTAFVNGARIEQQQTIDKAVIWVDENVGSLTAIALRKHLENK